MQLARTQNEVADALVEGGVHVQGGVQPAGNHGERRTNDGQVNVFAGLGNDDAWKKNVTVVYDRANSIRKALGTNAVKRRDHKRIALDPPEVMAPTGRASIIGITDTPDWVAVCSYTYWKKTGRSAIPYRSTQTWQFWDEYVTQLINFANINNSLAKWMRG